MNNVEHPPQIKINEITVATEGAPVNFEIRTGDAVMVAGPNGAGKSALLYEIYRSVGAGRGEYYPGHRQITFNNGWDNLGQDVYQLRTNLYTHVDAFNRYKNQWSEDLFKAVIRRLTNADSAYNAKLAELFKRDVDAARRFSQENSGPLSILNSAFEAARMAVRFKPTGMGFRAVREGIEYDIDRLSDGERAALLMSGAVIVQDPYTVIAIDEPERNLHPSIASPLINALMRARPDVAFLFASHDLNLISGVRSDAILYVKNSTIVAAKPEQRRYDLKKLDHLDGIPEELKQDLLGSRQDILFVEGTYSSPDFQIYNAVYPDWKVVPKGGADQVIEAVKALSQNATLHWFKVAGIIDRDGRDKTEIGKFHEIGINALQFPTSENLIVLPEIVKTVATILAEVEGGQPVEIRLEACQRNTHKALKDSTDEIAARLAVWRINRLISETKISVSDIRNQEFSLSSIDTSQIVRDTKKEVENLASSFGSLDDLKNFPIKNTQIPSAVARGIGCDFDRYCRIVFKQVNSDGIYGERIRAIFLENMTALSVHDPNKNS